MSQLNTVESRNEPHLMETTYVIAVSTNQDYQFKRELTESIEQLSSEKCLVSA